MWAETPHGSYAIVHKVTSTLALFDCWHENLIFASGFISMASAITECEEHYAKLRESRISNDSVKKLEELTKLLGTKIDSNLDPSTQEGLHAILCSIHADMELRIVSQAAHVNEVLSTGWAAINMVEEFAYEIRERMHHQMGASGDLISERYHFQQRLNDIFNHCSNRLRNVSRTPPPAENPPPTPAPPTPPEPPKEGFFQEHSLAPGHYPV